MSVPGSAHHCESHHGCTSGRQHGKLSPKMKILRRKNTFKENVFKQVKHSYFKKKKSPLRDNEGVCFCKYLRIFNIVQTIIYDHLSLALFHPSAFIFEINTSVIIHEDFSLTQRCFILARFSKSVSTS